MLSLIWQLLPWENDTARKKPPKAQYNYQPEHHWSKDFLHKRETKWKKNRKPSFKNDENYDSNEIKMYKGQLK